MNGEHPKADTRRREAIDRVADRFESQLLGDIVRDRCYYDDGPVLRLANVMERAYSLADAGDVETEAASKGAFGAAEEIRDVIDAEAEAQVLARLDDVVADQDDIIDHHGPDGLRAVNEANKCQELGEIPGGDA
ncbi:hypothetical protein ACFQL1_01630 [Halomicroarcula sp. GCM10025709]|uniref:hypothetical protein n=1 Tax=Haloarcula TaxID=2237 RepID=UPI0024C42BC4|nr:hypothetical protein [Halomicroarcula sp. YJ-61-S]